MWVRFVDPNVAMWCHREVARQGSSQEPWCPGFLLGVRHRGMADRLLGWPLVSSPSSGGGNATEFKAANRIVSTDCLAWPKAPR